MSFPARMMKRERHGKRIAGVYVLGPARGVLNVSVWGASHADLKIVPADCV